MVIIKLLKSELYLFSGLSLISKYSVVSKEFSSLRFDLCDQGRVAFPRLFPHLPSTPGRVV